MCNPSASPVSSSASHTGVYDGSCNGTPLYAFGRTNVPTSPRSFDAARLVGRGRGILQRQRTGALEPFGCDRAPLGDPVVVDPARPHRELGILDAAELQPETRVHHRDVDALGVEHLHPLGRVEAGRVQVFVVAAATEVVEALARVAEPGEPAFDDDAILDQAPVVARGLVPTQADALVGEVCRAGLGSRGRRARRGGRRRRRSGRRSRPVRSQSRSCLHDQVAVTRRATPCQLSDATVRTRRFGRDGLDATLGFADAARAADDRGVPRRLVRLPPVV